MPLREHGDSARRERFEGVFADVYRPLQRYVRRRAADSAVDDVVADTLLVLWRRLDDVPAGNELAWSYGTARRCLANYRRAEDRRDRLTVRVAGEAATASQAVADADPELTSALDELSADDREMVRLWAWEQLAPREIAVVLAITSNAASIRLHRAKQRLAERLDAEKESGRVVQSQGPGSARRRLQPPRRPRSGKDTGLAGHKPGGDQTGPHEEGA